MRRVGIPVLAALIGTAASMLPARSAAAPVSSEDLQALYARAAETGRAFTQAQQDLDDATRALARERSAARTAESEVADQSAVVAALTVQQLYDQRAPSPILTVLGQDDPRAVLERWSAYASTAEAMTARIDELAASQTVHEAAERRLERSRERLDRAVQQAGAARSAVNAALARSKLATLTASAATEGGEDSRDRSSAPEAEPATADAPSSRGAPPQPVVTPQAKVPATSPDDVSDVVWDRIAQCESGGNWHINTGNGYYGGLQFSAKTWRGIGGPGLPHEHSREVQIHYAKLLQARYGWGQWSCAGARFG